MGREIPRGKIKELKKTCGSTKCIGNLVYCLNEEAKGKPNGAHKKINNLYYCCVMNSNGEIKNLLNAKNCKYRTEGIEIIQK